MLSVIIGTLIITAQSSCPSNFPTAINGYCYFISPEREDPLTARTNCQLMGGELAKIYDMNADDIRGFTDVLPSRGTKLLVLNSQTVYFVAL